LEKDRIWQTAQESGDEFVLYFQRKYAKIENDRFVMLGEPKEGKAVENV
jgi:hypothetical protein